MQQPCCIPEYIGASPPSIILTIIHVAFCILDLDDSERIEWPRLAVAEAVQLLAGTQHICNQKQKHISPIIRLLFNNIILTTAG